MGGGRAGSGYRARVTSPRPGLPTPAGARPAPGIRSSGELPTTGMRAWVAYGLLVLMAGAGLGVDTARGHPPGAGLGVGLLVASVLVAVRVRPASLATAVIAPPLVAAGVVAAVLGIQEGFGSMRAAALSLATQLALLAPWVWGATLLAGIIVLVRRVRRARHRAAAGAAHAAARTTGSPPPR
jgi:hypothetical protein